MSRHRSKKVTEMILEIHAEIAKRVEERLRGFRRIWERGDDTELFVELVFCILTPQSGAKRCWRAVQNLLEAGHLFNGGAEDICRELNIVRFRNNKTSYILEAREAFLEGNGSIGRTLRECGTADAMRMWLAGSVKGIGYKEASHYLRNIGLGESLAILDRHVLRNMLALGLIDRIPDSISRRRYHELEKKLSRYSERIGVPLAHLDFVLLFKETGDIFK